MNSKIKVDGSEDENELYYLELLRLVKRFAGWKTAGCGFGDGEYYIRLSRTGEDDDTADSDAKTAKEVYFDAIKQIKSRGETLDCFLTDEERQLEFDDEEQREMEEWKAFLKEVANERQSFFTREGGIVQDDQL